MDPDQKDLLVEMIAELMTSTDPTVLGSALFAYQEVRLLAAFGLLAAISAGSISLVCHGLVRGFDIRTMSL